MKFLIGFVDMFLHNVFGDYRIFKTKVGKKNLRERFYYVKNSKILYVNILGWHSYFLDAFSLRRHLSKKGISCLTYEFQNGILSSDAKLTKENFLRLNKIVRNDIKKYKSQYGFDEIVVSGTSLGAVLAFLISNGNKLIKKIILIVPGLNLAESLWGGIITQKLRRKFEKKNINLKKLTSLWKEITPNKNINKLKGKKIVVFASKSDKIIPFIQAQKLCDEFKRRKYNFECYFNKFLGHYLTIFFTYRKSVKKLGFL